MYLKGVRYEIGRVHAMATAPTVLDLVTSGRLDPGAVITRTIPFTMAVDGMTDPSVKVVFVNDLT
jgi:threonine dehydrogenase-like Zn-dependent dehydrogenase